MANAAVLGDKTSHAGVISASGAKLTVAGKPVVLTGDPAACTSPSHATVVAGASKLIVGGKTVAKQGSPCACGATVLAISQTKLIIP